MEDGRCKLGLQGRLELVRLIEGGATLRAAAAALSVAPATAHRWWHRWQAASDAERVSRSCLRTRPSRPRSCPWGLDGEAEAAILTAREKTNYGPMQLQFLTGRLSDLLCVRSGLVDVLVGESVSEVDLEGSEGVWPAVGSLPGRLGSHDREVDELGGGLLVGEVSAGLDRLADLAVEVLDAVGGVDDAAQVGGQREEGRQVFPAGAP